MLYREKTTNNINYFKLQIYNTPLLLIKIQVIINLICNNHCTRTQREIICYKNILILIIQHKKLTNHSYSLINVIFTIKKVLHYLTNI
jgi:hypothetical protein